MVLCKILQNPFFQGQDIPQRAPAPPSVRILSSTLWKTSFVMNDVFHGEDRFIRFHSIVIQKSPFSVFLFFPPRGSSNPPTPFVPRDFWISFSPSVPRPLTRLFQRFLCYMLEDGPPFFFQCTGNLRAFAATPIFHIINRAFFFPYEPFPPCSHQRPSGQRRAPGLDALFSL